jgi:hypothetical protein
LSSALPKSLSFNSIPKCRSKIFRQPSISDRLDLGTGDRHASEYMIGMISEPVIGLTSESAIGMPRNIQM